MEITTDNVKELCGINARLIDWKIKQQWRNGRQIVLSEKERSEVQRMAEVLRGEVDELKSLAEYAITDAPPRIELTAATLQGMRVFVVGGHQFIRLPRELWRSAGKCSCQYCKGGEGFWDTLAITGEGKAGPHGPTTYTVHMPELQKRF